MSKDPIAFIVLLPLLSACSSTHPEGSAEVAAESSAAEEVPTAVDGVADSAAPEAPPAEAGAPEESSYEAQAAARLALWNDPRFQQLFAESYMAETEIEPRVTLADRDRMQEVLELVSTDKADEAIEMLEEHRGEAASAVFDFTLGNLYFERDRLGEAAAAYRVAVDKYPKFRRAWRFLGLAYVRLERWAEALPALTRVIELGGGDALTYGLLGLAYTAQDDSIAAESAYRMAILLDPTTLDLKLGLARSLFMQQRYADASALCDALIAKAPDNADLWLLQANAFIGMGKSLEAASNFELVDHLGESTPDTLRNLGDIYVNEELFDLAVRTYARALERDPAGSVERAVRAAKVLTSRGAVSEPQELVDLLEALPEGTLSSEQRLDTLRLRARLAVAEGASEEEARVLEEIVQLDPLDGAALVQLGRIESRAGDAEQAIFWFERAESLEAFEADAKVGHAQVLVGQGKHAEALPLLRRAQTLKPREHVAEYIEHVERVAKSR